MTDINVACFLSCAKTGSLSVTAGDLSMTNQAVSQSIQKFEEEIGYKLFIRGTQPMRLSLAGEVALQWLMKREQRFEWADDYFSNKKDNQRHIPRIAFVDWAGLPECVREYIDVIAHQQPSMDVELCPGSEHFILDLFQKCKTDVIILPDRIDSKIMSPPDIFSAPLISMSTLQLCYSRSFINTDGSTDYRRLLSTRLFSCIDRDWLSDRFETLRDSVCSKYKVPPSAHERVENFNSIISEVVLGNGYTFCSNVLPHVSSMNTLLKFESISQYITPTVPMICVWQLTAHSESILEFTEMVCKP